MTRWPRTVAPFAFLLRGPYGDPKVPAHEIGEGEANDISISQDGSRLAVSTIGLNSALPCCSVNHHVVIDSQSSEVWLRGDTHPAIEVYRYSANGSAQTLLQSSDSDFDGVASFPMFRDRVKHWIGGMPVSL